MMSLKCFTIFCSCYKPKYDMHNKRHTVGFFRAAEKKEKEIDSYLSIKTCPFHRINILFRMI